MYQHSLSLSLTQERDYSLTASIGRSFDKSEIKTKPQDALLIASNNEPPQKAQCSPKVVYSVIGLTFFIIICVGIIIFVLISPTESDNMDTLDRQWFYDVILNEKMDDTNLSHGILLKQLTLYQPEQGLYRINYDEYWNYNGENTMELNILLNAQSQIIYNFANAYQNTSYQPFLNAMYNGLQILLTQFYDDIYGGYYRSITKYINGSYAIVDSHKDSYHLSFAIIALCKSYQVTLNETYLHKASDIYWILINDFIDSTGSGLYYYLHRNMTQTMDRDKSDENMLYYFHSLMQLYDAYKQYYIYNEIINGSMLIEINQRVNDVYDFIMSLRVNTNFTVGDNDNMVEYLILPSKYDENWTAHKPYNQNINFGHNFQYTLFIWQYIEMDLIERNETNIWNADNIFNYSLSVGYNESMSLTKETDFWVGIQALRSMIYFYYKNTDANYNDSELFYFIIEAHNQYKSVYYDNKYGGMYENPIQGMYDKSKNTKVGYHLSQSCFDILKWTV